MSAAITVVGLGSGGEDQMTLGIWRRLQKAQAIYVRTLDHPVCRDLEDLQLSLKSFDHIYEAKSSFPEVYDSIANELIELAKQGVAGEEIIYAVPGHPMVAEATVGLLKDRCSEQGVGLTILGGESFLDQAFIRLGIDPIEGFQLLDAGVIDRELIQPKLHTLIGQVYDVFTASDVKLSLMEVYPDDTRVIVGHALGIEGQEVIQEVELYELDRVEGYGNLSLIYIPKSDDEKRTRRTFGRLHEIVEILRSPEGCPWDREQTHASIRKNLIEETYEVLETIDDDDPDHMKEELGDLLLQIMLHSQMEEELGTFSVYDVIEGLNDKLIFRHPHVFGDNKAEDAGEALANWEAMKAEEKKRKGQDERVSVLDGVPRDLPALMKAYKLQKKASKVGFDWDKVEDIFLKVEEELNELKEAIQKNYAEEEQMLELGDVLFATANIARFIGADPEEALAATNRKFTRRFQYIEQRLAEQGKGMKDSDIEEMESYWQEAKQALKDY